MKKTFSQNPSFEAINELIAYKQQFFTSHLLYNQQLQADVDYANTIRNFIDTFSKNNLATSNYMNLYLDTNDCSTKGKFFEGINISTVLKHLSYIIWTDKMADNFFMTKIKDNTIYNLLKRLEEIQMAN